MKIYRLVFLLFLLSNCSENKKTDKPISAERKIEKVNFFMEVSGSMAGYMKGSTDFVKMIPNLLVAIEQKVDSGKLKLRNYYIADSIVPFKGNTEEFIYTLSTRQPAVEKSSEMHRIFQMIANKTDSNDISMFVSDCILSYSDRDVQANKEINREKAEGGLKPFITSAFNKLKNKNDMCASVYGFNSDFNGIYYTYQNGRIPIAKGEIVRPYYLWVIGNKELLKRFNAQLYQLEGFKPDVAIDFGIFDKPVTEYGVFFRFMKNGEWDLEGKELNNAKIPKNGQATLAIGLDLSALPPYARDTNYLMKRLQLSKETADFKISRILLAEDVDKPALKKNELDVLGAASHIFVIEVNNLYKPHAELEFNLPLQYDTSYRAISILDDRDKSKISGKTFGFEYLVDGVRAAYQNPNQDFVKISIPVKK